VIGLLANTAATYFYLLFGWEDAAASKTAVIALAVLLIIGATYLTLIGIEVSAKTQIILTIAQIGALVLFALVVLVRVFIGEGAEASVEPAPAWFSPFAIDGSTALVAGVLIGVFVYWGWDSAVTVNEETEDASHAPGKAAVMSTVILLGLYLLCTTAAVAWLGADGLAQYEDETAFDVIAGEALGSPLDKLVVLAVLTSALASTQTTVLPSSRTALSMARAGAAPHSLARIHPRFLTPSTATIVVATLAIVFYVGFRVLSEAFYEASLAALGLLICINYGLNGLACVVYYRRALGRSLRTAVIAGALPIIGSLLFAAILVKSTRDFAVGGLEDTTYWFGVQAPLVITIGLFVLAAAIILLTRSGPAKEFFSRKLEAAPPDALDAPPGSPAASPPPLALASRDSRFARAAAGEPLDREPAAASSDHQQER
jgi:amino acid transporter